MWKVSVATEKLKKLVWRVERRASWVNELELECTESVKESRERTTALI